MTISVSNQTNAVREKLVITDATSAGVYINNSSGTTIRNSVITNCKLRGIGDFDKATGTKLLYLVIDANGRDGGAYNGDGILLQSQRPEVGWCVISSNGDNSTYEHGIYVAGTARDVHIHDCVLTGNAASAIKAQGTGRIECCLIAGSQRGIVFDDDQPGDFTITGCTISATQYAIQVDANTRLARYHSDYNHYAAGSKFSNKGVTYDLAGWQKATGLDLHSTVG